MNFINFLNYVINSNNYLLLISGTLGKINFLSEFS